MNYVVTGFDEKYWHHWGVSWIASLKELAKFQGTILIVDFGLPFQVKKQLSDLGVYLLPGTGSNFRAGILNAVSTFAKQYKGTFCVWDADVYFQSSIDEIFDLASKQLLTTRAAGFYAGPQFELLSKLQKMVTFVENKDAFCHNCLVQSFSTNCLIVDDTWNFTQVMNTADLEKQKVIHPSGMIKPLIPGKKIAFWEKYSHLYDNYLGVNSPKTKSRLVKSGYTT